MSRDYSIHTTFELPFTQENVQVIIQKAFDLDFVYLVNNENEELFSINMPFLTVDQAVFKIVTIANKMGEYDLPFLLKVNYQDTDFFLWFYESENKLIEMRMGIFGYRWDKQFERGSKDDTIDFSRYIRLLLNICSNIILLKLETSSDLVEGIKYVDQGCVTALIRMGPFEKSFTYDSEWVKESFIGLISNGFVSKFTFFDENTNKPIIPSAQKFYEILKNDFPVYLYATKDGVSFKIEVKRNNQEYEYDFVSIYPLEPYHMKKGYGSEKEKIDLAFYVQRLLELCENFAIYELKTFF